MGHTAQVKFPRPNPLRACYQCPSTGHFPPAAEVRFNSQSSVKQKSKVSMHLRIRLSIVHSQMGVASGSGTSKSSDVGFVHFLSSGSSLLCPLISHTKNEQALLKAKGIMRTQRASQL